MKHLKILIVEDDKGIQSTYDRDITSYNKGSKNVNIIPTYEIDKEQALQILFDASLTFDGAIIDIDLKGSGGQDTSGNDVIREIKNNLRFPVFVISGTTHNLDADLNKPSNFFKVVNRDDSEFDFIAEFVSIYNTGITNLLNRNGEIESLMSNIFWNHLSNSLNIWINDNSRSSEQKEKSLLRYTILHMLEYLDENNVHPSEFYITPPVKKVLSTGDLVSIKDIRYVVLTPACDFVIRPNGDRNVKNAFLLKIIELTDHFSNFEDSIQKGEISNSLKKELGKLITNNKPYYHFIPKHNTIKAGIIDFQNKLSIPIKEIESEVSKAEFNRFATISLPFLKDLVERYSSYYARQGSPDFNVDEVIESLLK